MSTWPACNTRPGKGRQINLKTTPKKRRQSEPGSDPRQGPYIINVMAREYETPEAATAAHQIGGSRSSACVQQGEDGFGDELGRRTTRGSPSRSTAARICSPRPITCSTTASSRPPACTAPHSPPNPEPTPASTRARSRAGGRQPSGPNPTSTDRGQRFSPPTTEDLAPTRPAKGASRHYVMRPRRTLDWGRRR